MDPRITTTRIIEVSLFHSHFISLKSDYLCLQCPTLLRRVYLITSPSKTIIMSRTIPNQCLLKFCNKISSYEGVYSLVLFVSRLVVCINLSWNVHTFRNKVNHWIPICSFSAMCKIRGFIFNCRTPLVQA